jgi:hypothetical protein
MLHEIYSAAAFLKPKSRRAKQLQLLPPSILLFQLVIQRFDASLENFCEPARTTISLQIQRLLKPLSNKDKTALVFCHQPSIHAI